MRLALPLATLALAACTPKPEPAPAPAPVKKAARPPDDTHRFPAQNQVESKLVTEPLYGHPFLPAGNIATYKKGSSQYELLLVRAASPTDAAILLLDYKKALQNPKLIAHFGGYFGQDNGRSVFVFTKTRWLAAVVGLPEAEADAIARTFAARLD